ncbi:hypothetical protein [Glaciibacter sp. 2TAF33]|uniref:hypothetical protein n=1 Tax=Glaciibacter sp. 2TAF33 TaxID=3233015 RepID=UPI003F8D9739
MGATDATQREFLAAPGEPGLANRLVRDLPGFVQPAYQPKQRDLLVECGQAAEVAEFVEPGAGGAEVNFFAQRDCVVADDDAQDGFQ